MKKIFYSLTKTLLIVSLIFATSCSDDDDDNGGGGTNGSDPEGTIHVSMRNYSNGSTSVTPDNCYNSFHIDNGNNFVGSGSWDFVSLGEMKGLGNITQIPTSGWAKKIAVVPGRGYVAANFGSKGVTYVRIYVTDYTLNIYDEIIGYEVKYQSPFTPAINGDVITLSKSEVFFAYNASSPYYYDVQTITLSPYNTSWSISSSAQWCQAYASDLNSFRISLSEYNNLKEPRTATVTIKMNGVPDATIKVTQYGY